MSEKEIPKTQAPVKEVQTKGKVLSFGDNFNVKIDLKAVHSAYRCSTSWKLSNTFCLIMLTDDIDEFLLTGIQLEIHPEGFIKATGARSLGELRDALQTARNHVLADYIIK